MRTSVTHNFLCPEAERCVNPQHERDVEYQRLRDAFREYGHPAVLAAAAARCDRWDLADHRRRALLAKAGNFTRDEWIDRIAEFGGRCAYCLGPGPITIDHDIPLCRGGSNTIDNIVPACSPCNTQKGTRTGYEFVMHRGRGDDPVVAA